jgi:hexosaminidase
MRIVLIFLLVVVLPLSAKELPIPPLAGQLNLMPWPSRCSLGSGHFIITPSFSVAMTGYREARLERGVQRFFRDLSQRTGIIFTAQLAGPETASLVIHTGSASREFQEPGEDESYSLEVTSSAAQLSAPNPLGALHGLQTFLQLVEASPAGFAAPVIAIQDAPRFPWRGLMVDVGRHFIPLDVLRRNLDGMAAVKLNVFHWHLSEDQGFRVESKTFPKLHEMGSDGLFYTQDEIRGFIAYARDRGIRVVPEFDMPGHSTAWFVGYPELASGPGPYSIERKWGIFDPAMDPTRDSVYTFLDDFIAEMAALFPDPYFHIGGDEVNGKQWGQNPEIQQFMTLHNLRNNQELQAYFTGRVQKIVSSHGKTMVGWDEVLTPGMSQHTVIQSWRGTDALTVAVKQGYFGLLSNGFYLDLMWPASRHYAVDPVTGEAGALSMEEKARILGGEATMWDEYASPENIDSRIWPRMASIAERLWSAAEVRDVLTMYGRLDKISWHLDQLGLTHNSSYDSMLQRAAGTPDVTALRVLADVVEPVKDYQREELARPAATSTTPLNRLVDAVRPESAAARRFSIQMDKLIAGHCKDANEMQRMRIQMTIWRDNAARLQPLIANSFLLKEVSSISQDLASVGLLGLEALDYIDQKKQPRDSWPADGMVDLEKMVQPTSAQLLLMVVAPVQRLVEASARTCQAVK